LSSTPATSACRTAGPGRTGPCSAPASSYADPYDVVAARATLVAGGCLGIERWLDDHVRQTYGDDEALAAFGPARRPPDRLTVP
jgi:hypothetical protein